MRRWLPVETRKMGVHRRKRIRKRREREREKEWERSARQYYYTRYARKASRTYTITRGSRWSGLPTGSNTRRTWADNFTGQKESEIIRGIIGDRRVARRRQSSTMISFVVSPRADPRRRAPRLGGEKIDDPSVPKRARPFAREEIPRGRIRATRSKSRGENAENVARYAALATREK